jgi:hypothetical protein
MRVNNLSVVLMILLVFGSFGSKLSAQPLTTPVQVTPDCLLYFDFTDNGSSASFDNRFIGCKTWYVAYTNTGFPALTLTFQDAPDATGVPGAWVAFAGTVVEGVNPNVAVTQASTVLYGYYPWQRITLSGAVAGAGRRLRGTFYGYRQVPVASIIFPPAAAVTANQGTAGLITAPWPVILSNGAAALGTLTNPLYTTPSTACTLSAIIELAPAGIGNQQIIALTALKSIRVCNISFASSAAADVKLTQGTGANCATGTANLTGTYRNVLSASIGTQLDPLTTASAQALCLNSSAGVNIGGVILYDKF